MASTQPFALPPQILSSERGTRRSFAVPSIIVGVLLLLGALFVFESSRNEQARAETGPDAGKGVDGQSMVGNSPAETAASRTGASLRKPENRPQEAFLVPKYVNRAAGLAPTAQEAGVPTLPDRSDVDVQRFERPGFAERDSKDIELTAWGDAERGGTIDHYEDYVRSYPTGSFRLLAETRVQLLMEAIGEPSGKLQVEAVSPQEEKTFAGTPRLMANDVKDKPAEDEGGPMTSTSEATINGYWRDASSGVLWTVRDNRYDISWKGANEYCEKLNVGGLRGWRLPTIGELRRMHDPTATTLYKVRKPVTLSSWLVWSGTVDGSAGAAFLMFYATPQIGVSQVDVGPAERSLVKAARALCVRSAQR